MSTNDGNFFARLVEERKRLGFSQEQIADKCGLSRKMWGNYESGKTYPGVDVLFVLLKEGGDITYIMTGSRVGAEMQQDLAPYHRTELEELADVYAKASENGKQALLSLARFIKDGK